MPTQLQRELQILKYAGTGIDPAQGRHAKISDLSELIPDTQEIELIAVMKRLFANGFLGLRIWDAALPGERDYLGELEDNEKFFYGAVGFFLKQTPTTAWYLPH